MKTLNTLRALSLDSQNLSPVEIDRGIRETIRGLGLSVLAIGLALVRVKAEKIFLELNFRNLTAYIEDLARESKYDRATVFCWLKIGETWLKYREELQDMGYNEGNCPTKLAFLEKALEKRPRDEVFDNLLIMSFRDFRAYARGEKEKGKGKVPFWEIRGNILYIEGQRAIIMNRSLGGRNTRMLIKAMKAACRALEQNGYLVAVHLNSPEEMRRFRVKAKRLRARMRGEK